MSRHNIPAINPLNVPNTLNLNTLDPNTLNPQHPETLNPNTRKNTSFDTAEVLENRGGNSSGCATNERSSLSLCCSREIVLRKTRSDFFVRKLGRTTRSFEKSIQA